MNIATYSYQENVGSEREWRLSKTSFCQTNLLVGKNATGKSRALRTLAKLAKLITGEQKGFSDGHWVLRLGTSDKELEYELKIHDKKIDLERITKICKHQTDVILERDVNGVGSLWAEQKNEMIDFELPPEQLIVTARQDRKQHPFLIEIVQWATGLFHYEFATRMGFENIGYIAEVPGFKGEDFDPKNTAQVSRILDEGLRDFGNDFKNAILHDINKLGYEISDVGIDAPYGVRVESNIPGRIAGIYVQEKDLSCKTDQITMSQGMARALSVIIQLNYNYVSGQPSCVLIDDIGEGLDFERSSALVKVIIERSQSSNVQVIMATNDRFIMNAVPLKYWHYLKRDGHEVKSINITDYPKIFEEFSYMGLNNFDFFATDFPLEYLK